MGNSRSEVELAIQLDKQFYYAGETLNGKVLLNAKKKLACAALVLFIEGTETSEFQTVGNVNVKGINNLINTNYDITLMDNMCSRLLSGSYNESRGYKAQISYKIKAILQPAARDRTPIENSTQIIIREPQKMDQTVLFGQCFAKCMQCGCFDRGVSRVTCFFEKNYYFPSDDCVVLCEIDNIRCRLGVNAVHCRFMKEVTLTAGNGASRVFTQELNVSSFGGVAAGSAYSGQNSQRSIIRLIYKDNQQGVHPSTNGQLVKCEYYLLVRPEFAGCFVSARQDQFRVKVNILQPAMIYEPIVQPDSWRPSLEQNSNIFLNLNEKNELLSSMDES